MIGNKQDINTVKQELSKITFTNKVATKILCTDKLCDYYTLFNLNSLRDSIVSSTPVKGFNPTEIIESSNVTNIPSKIPNNGRQLKDATEVKEIKPKKQKKTKTWKSTETTKSTKSTCDVGKKLYSNMNFETKLSEYRFDGNTIFVIQNSHRLINFFSYFKRPCEPTIYMYIETLSHSIPSKSWSTSDQSTTSKHESTLATGNVVFVATCASAFPVIIAKFPIRAPNVKAVSIGSCYEFPLKNITSYIQKTDRTNGFYVMALKQEQNNGIVLEYVSMINESTSKCNSVIEVNKSAALHSVFFQKINSIDLFNEDINKEIDYNQQINSMEVLMLVNGTEEITTGSKRIIENSTQHMIISNDSIKLTQKGKTDELEQILAFKKNSLIWKLDVPKDSNITMNMIKYTNLFKNYDKITQSNDSIYYAICKWREYKKTDTYMLLKIISAEAINTKPTVRNMGGHSQVTSKDKNTKILFGDLFNNVEIVFEMYLAHPI